MAFALILVLGLLAMSLVAWFSFMAKRKRRQGFALMATQLGFEYSPQDPFGILAEPFALFEKGDGRGVENVLWGRWQDLDVRLFDYWYYDETTDSKGNRRRTYYRFDCVIAPVEAACSRLVIEHENLGTRIANALTFHDIQFESEEFNKAFYVKSPDAKFANDFVDARMMDWLLASGKGFSFEVDGGELLCSCRKVAPTAIVPLLGTAKAFREHIPRVVASLYPSAGGSGSDGPPPSDVEARNEARWLAGHYTPPDARDPGTVAPPERPD